MEFEKCDKKLPTKRDSIESTFCTFSIRSCCPSFRRSSHWMGGSCTAVCERLSILSKTFVPGTDENGDNDDDGNGEDDSRPRALRRSNSCSRYCFGMNGHSPDGRPDTQRFKTVGRTIQILQIQIHNTVARNSINTCVKISLKAKY